MMEQEIDWVQVQNFTGFIWRLALRHDASVTSGCRSPERNAAKGGHPKSKHTFSGGWGMACDLMLDSPASRPAAMEECREAGYYPVVKDGYAPGQLHVQGWAYGESPRWGG